MEKRKIRYRFSRTFPERYESAFLVAFSKATEMWEKAGCVEFIYSHQSPDFTITWEMVGKEYGDISKRLYTPEMSYRNHIIGDAEDSALIVNCLFKWKTKWYHFFRKEFDPIIIAHNLGHVMGLCLKKHVRDMNSVMFENPFNPPQESDFQILRIALSKRK